MRFMAVLGYLEQKIFFVAQPWWATFISGTGTFPYFHP